MSTIRNNLKTKEGSKSDFTFGTILDVSLIHMNQNLKVQIC